MPSSIVRTFTDPDELAATVRGATTKVTMIESGRFTGKLAWIDLHHLLIQRFFDNLQRTSRGIYTAGQAHIVFYTAPGPRIFQDGLEILPTSIVRFRDADEHYQRTSGLSSYATMSLPVEDLVSASVIGGFDLTLPQDTMLVTPPAAALTRLRRLHAAAGRLAEEAPEIIANPDAAGGLEQTLIEAMVDCLGHGEQRENTRAQGQHANIMRRFHREIEENLEQPLYIPEICKAIGASERTLRACCQEHLGMSPKRYLLLRRMHLARRALRRADPAAMTVTEIATSYGFWELGRFSVAYRSLFGETPLASLRRPPEDPHPKKIISSPWELLEIA